MAERTILQCVSLVETPANAVTWRTKRAIDGFTTPRRRLVKCSNITVAVATKTDSPPNNNAKNLAPGLSNPPIVGFFAEYVNFMQTTVSYCM